MAFRSSRNRLLACLTRRPFLGLAVAAFVLVRVQSGSWGWALLAGVLLDPVLPILLMVSVGVWGVLQGSRRRSKPKPKVFIPVPEIDADERSAECVKAIREARNALIRAGSARVQLVRDFEMDAPVVDFGRGPINRGLSKLAERVRHFVGDGVIDLLEHRMMLDYGGYAESQTGVDHWAGHSGGPLRQRDSERAERPSPLWFIAALDRATRAADTGEEQLRGKLCRRLDVLLDLSAAAQGSPTMWIPEWPDLTRVPMVAWLEGPQLSQLRYEETEGLTYTLTIWDTGLELTGLDWHRTGTFRTAPDMLRAAANEV